MKEQPYIRKKTDSIWTEWIQAGKQTGNLTGSSLSRFLQCRERSTWGAWGKSLGIDCISGFLMAVSVQVFAVNANFAPGGLNGAAVIINYLTNLPIGMVIVLLNIPVILLSYRLLGKLFLAKSVKSMLIGAVFMDHVAVYLPGYYGSPMLASIFAGIFAGAGCAILYIDGSCTGGSDFLIMSMKQLKPHLSVGQLVQVIDGSVLIFAGLVFHNVDAVLYGVIYTWISSTVVDKLMDGSLSGKITVIITRKGKEVCQAIDNRTGRGSTRFLTASSDHKETRDVVMCICSKKQAATIRSIVAGIDSSADLIITEYKEAFGSESHPLSG